jgi:hypothetical protein
VRHRLVLIGMACLLATAPAAAAPPWPYPDQLRDRLVWVHPLVNYAFDPRWQREWERELARGRAIRTNVGSVSTDDLLTVVQVNVSEPLGGRFRFLYRLDWRDALHVDLPEQQHWLGFAAAIVRPVEAELQVHPAADKEDFDLRAGLLLADAERARYLRVGARWDDFLYGKKNDRGGVSRQESRGVQWELRWAAGRWELASAGSYAGSWSRVYPDSALSPLVAAATGRRGEGSLRLRFLTRDDAFVEAGAAHYVFRGGERRRDPDDSYGYANEWLHAHALALLDLSARVGLRPEFHWLRQWASADGRRTFTHRREDVFPAVFVQLRPGGRSTWELGYMASHHSWEFSGRRVGGYTDKVKAGWIFAFTPRARLQCSLSHELDLDRFGGGNVQYQMLF